MRVLAFFLIFLLIFSLPSCKKEDLSSCEAILSEMMENEVGLPAGKIYLMHANEGDENYLSDYLMFALYGDGEKPVMADGWLDLAVFLPSSDHPCEIAVFLCDCEDTATDTARMLCRRLDMIRTAKHKTEYSHYFESATVTVVRNYVLFVISSDSENAIKAASKIIG